MWDICHEIEPPVWLYGMWSPGFITRHPKSSPHCSIGAPHVTCDVNDMKPYRCCCLHYSNDDGLVDGTIGGITAIVICQCAVQTVVDYAISTICLPNQASLSCRLMICCIRVDQLPTVLEHLALPSCCEQDFQSLVLKAHVEVSRFAVLDTERVKNSFKAPSYLKELIVPYYPTRTLRSLNAGLLVVPIVSKSRTGARAFSYQAPLQWNQLPVVVREADTLSTFKKTFLFSSAALRRDRLWVGLEGFGGFPGPRTQYLAAPSSPLTGVGDGPPPGVTVDRDGLSSVRPNRVASFRAGIRLTYNWRKGSAAMSATHPTRLETRTKESTHARVRGSYETPRCNESDGRRAPAEVGSRPVYLFRSLFS
ncbi:hypothetical protein N1851_000119 [Merluccius polli]|uniref:Uncharacterized protein n=1 Tax=Merluccius polli TaxID=89951 RepID=A0AA47NCP8_MERPO|nr:hypothetical protein N1851_000119 [Merluccius polli]